MAFRRAARRFVVVFVATVAVTASATTSQVLTVAKVVRLENRGDPERNGGVIAVGGDDRAFATLLDPTCPTSSAVEVEAYLQSTLRDAVLARVDLDCVKWSTSRTGFQYRDPAGTVRSIRYGRTGLRVEVRGPGFTPIAGPVGFVQGQLQIGERLLRARFHNFRRNDASVVQSRKPSLAAAAGEAGFWDALSGDASTERDEQAVIRNLEKAVRRDRRDGRSHFLLAMIHLYRFGQRVTRFTDVSADARADLAAANAAFATAVPMLWNDATGTGDSRVPGFSAAAKYLGGVVEGDAALQAEGLADLDRAVRVNTFFNVFDFIPVIQVLRPTDPMFQQVFEVVTVYLNDPETLACVGTQPEICSNAGLAPRNLQGSLTLFGDLYAKAGNLERARFWYGLANAFPETASWRFAAALQDRITHAAERVQSYQDGDAANDPPIIGAAAEACAMCHNR